MADAQRRGLTEEELRSKMRRIGSCRKYRPHSEATKKKISESNKLLWTDERRKMWSVLSTGRRHTEETKLKLSEIGKLRVVSDVTRQRLSVAGTGRRHTEESKRRISEGNKGRVVSSETKKALSVSAHRRIERGEFKNVRSVTQLSMSGDFIATHVSIASLGRLGFDASAVGHCCRGLYKSHKGYKFVYTEDFTGQV